MRILTVPQDTSMLRTKSSPVSQISPEIIQFLRELGKSLKNQHDPQGVGLSAIQVGRPIRAFATFLPSILKGPTSWQGRTLSDATNELRFYINPEIVDHSKEVTLGEDLVSSPRPSSLSPRPFLEGCLSIPSIYGPVPRWSWIKARAIILGESDLSSARFTLHASRPSVMSSGLRLRGRSDSRRSNDFTLEKLASRVFQHELDHLNGILFTDRTLEAGLQLYESKEKELVPMEM